MLPWDEPASLASLFDEFIDLPIPNVNELETTELHMAIAEINSNTSVSAVSRALSVPVLAVKL